MVTIKEFLMNQHKTLNERKATLTESLINSESKEERAEIGETLKTLAAEIAAVEEQLSSIDEPAGGEGGEGRGLNVLSTLEMRGAKSEEGTSSLEYRKAFQKYMATGIMEARADETTKTTDANVATVIPENLVNKILEKFEQLGVIYNLVTKTAYAVGQSIPVDSVKPVATWVGRNTNTPASSTNGEGGTSDAQKKTLGALISFTHYKLRCEIRYTEEVSTMALPAFEALFVKQVGEAMLRAQEFAIVEGDGYGMPAGILNNTADEGKAIKTTKLEYKTLCDMEAALPVEYENGAKWCMTKKTFMGFMGMTDLQGQPIARVNYGINGKPERTLLGRDVVIYVPQTGSKLVDFSASAAEGSKVAFMYDFSDYVLNTNYDLGIHHAKDWDNEDHKTKAVLACDGKIIDKGSLVTLEIGSATAD